MMRAAETYASCGEVSCSGCAVTGISVSAGQGKGPLMEDWKEEQTWLEFGLIFKGVPGKHWVKQDNMDCNSLVRYPSHPAFSLVEHCACPAKKRDTRWPLCSGQSNAA